MDERDVPALVAGATAAHRSLFRTVDGLTDELARQPSLLPNWSVGHVLTHIARNADSHVRILEGTLAGEERDQYPGGADARNADIEAGSGRPATELVADVLDSADRLEAVWARMTPEAWRGAGRALGGARWPAPRVAFARWREVEVHHVDLGLGYTPDDWPDDYVAVELPRLLAGLPDRLDGPRQRALAAWLLDRGERPALDPLGPWQQQYDR